MPKYADLRAFFRALQPQLSLVVALVQIAEGGHHIRALRRLPDIVVRYDRGAVLRNGELRIRSKIGRDLFGLHLVDIEQLVLLEDWTRRQELCFELIPGQGWRPHRHLSRSKRLPWHARRAQLSMWLRRWGQIRLRMHALRCTAQQ